MAYLLYYLIYTIMILFIHFLLICLFILDGNILYLFTIYYLFIYHLLSCILFIILSNKLLEFWLMYAFNGVIFSTPTEVICLSMQIIEDLIWGDHLTIAKLSDRIQIYDGLQHFPFSSGSFAPAELIVRIQHWLPQYLFWWPPRLHLVFTS